MTPCGARIPVVFLRSCWPGIDTQSRCFCKIWDVMSNYLQWCKGLWIHGPLFRSKVGLEASNSITRESTSQLKTAYISIYVEREESFMFNFYHAVKWGFSCGYLIDASLLRRLCLSSVFKIMPLQSSSGQVHTAQMRQWLFPEKFPNKLFFSSQFSSILFILLSQEVPVSVSTSCPVAHQKHV